ncbi:hypothetical protein LM602_06380 [Candidatus Acetothermia bacterium]|jgi:hypothetical protein|nr:hypothetical protein [Candidatus Acetothermia bacterium]MCI2432163.1 hypothetical protein [Candidatus Acetothermia bacterium]MCI2436144.1 hypothetical protein [Candidatus Acetothermia bacterium]
MAELKDVQIKNEKNEVVWRIFADENDNIVFEYVKSDKRQRRFWLNKDGAIRGSSHSSITSSK